MGEIDKTTQDSLPQGQTSGGTGETTPKETPKTYTEQEAQKLVSDALAAKGRDAKTLSDKEASLNALQADIDAAKAEIVEFERQKDQAELEEARRDPAKMVDYQQKRNYRKLLQDLDSQKADLRRQQDEFNRQKGDHDQQIQQANQTMMEVKVWQIAGKYGVDADRLKKLNLPTIEAVEAVAKELSPVQRPPESTEAKEPEFTPDSGVTSGVSQPTPEQLEKMTPEQYAAHRKKQDPSFI